MGNVLGNLDRVVDVFEQTNQADSQAEADEQSPELIKSGRLGLIGTVGSTTFEGILTQGLFTTCCLRISNSISLSFIRRSACAVSSRSLSIDRIL